jgi:hypothetical protein
MPNNAFVSPTLSPEIQIETNINRTFSSKKQGGIKAQLIKIQT